jgi:hypothetical protein
VPVIGTAADKQVAIASNLEPTCKYRIIAIDPSVRGSDNKILTAVIEIPNERLAPGPRGYRVQVVDYDASNQILYKPAPHRETDNRKVPAHPETDRAFQARNAYAIVMRVLARFERALGRRVPWSFRGHQLILAPHAFLDLNAFYSKNDHAIFFGYYPGDSGNVFTCLSHEVIAHETTHALVDGLRPDYMYPSSPDQAAFHEGFADIVALLSVLSLREVVGAGLDLHTGDEKLIRASALTETALKQGVLFGLAQQVGEAMYGAQGVALRRSIELRPDPKLATSVEFQQAHRRGELLVAAALGAFLGIWKKRIDLFGELREGRVSRLGVVDAAVETADRLLTIAIRALDYCPPVHLVFGDFLSAMLTADYDLYPDDSRYGYRQALREGFASFGFSPAAEGAEPAAESGMWAGPGELQLAYDRTHFESMQRDPQEILRFLWENRSQLRFEESGYNIVESVWPCHRVASDGFFLRETVAVYSQYIKIRAGELSELGLEKPPDMPEDFQITFHGGGALIFDERGKLKYHVRKSIRNARRQNPWLQYLWRQGSLTRGKSFAVLHLERALRRDLSSPHPGAEEDGDRAGRAN